MFTSTILAAVSHKSGKRIVSGAALRISVLATALGFSTTGVLSTVTPGISQIELYVTEDGLAPCCTYGHQTASNPSGSLATLRRSASMQCPSGACYSFTAKGTGTVSWKHAYEGSVTTDFSTTFTQSYSGSASHSQFNWSYEFATDSPYQLTVECSRDLSDPFNASLLTGGVTIDDNPLQLCNPGVSVHLTPGNHTLTGGRIFTARVFGPMANNSGTVREKSLIKWRLDGCESRKEIAVSTNDVGGIVFGHSCGDEEPANSKQLWLDEQSAYFDLRCEGFPQTPSSFFLKYKPIGIGPYDSATCVWGGGQNFANIFTPGDADNDGLDDCFIRSSWHNEEPGQAQGVPGLQDRCVFKFDVKTKKLKRAHEVLAGTAPNQRWRQATFSELGGVDLCASLPGGLALGPDSVTDNTGTAMFCDQNGDGVCNANDNSILASAIGSASGDALYSFSLDLDDDGLVLDDDMGALFPSLDFDGDGTCQRL